MQALHTRRSTTAAATMTLAHLARQAAGAWADEPAFIEDGKPVSFSRIFEQARQVARGMRELGLRPGDVVSFQLPNWGLAGI